MTAKVLRGTMLASMREFPIRKTGIVAISLLAIAAMVVLCESSRSPAVCKVCGAGLVPMEEYPNVLKCSSKCAYAVDTSFRPFVSD